MSFLGYPYPTSSQLLVSTPTSGSGSCCESGRTIGKDPHTGQAICSCQYDPSRTPIMHPRVPAGLPLVYSPPYGSEQGYVPPTFGADTSAFYSLNGGTYEHLKSATEGWTANPYQPTPCYPPYDPAYQYYGDRYSAMDINGAARRKNATRETTSTLKAWLYEHRKNPYPTKGEKIMLAIITKMTLTQVSTWFANARRRLKKENKMTWSPRNRCGDDRKSACDSDEEKDRSSDKESGRDLAENPDEDVNLDDISCDQLEEEKGEHSVSEEERREGDLSNSEASQEDRTGDSETTRDVPSASQTIASEASQPQSRVEKPKIWSLASLAHSSSSSGGGSSSSSTITSSAHLAEGFRDRPPAGYHPLASPHLHPHFGRFTAAMPGLRPWAEANAAFHESLIYSQASGRNVNSLMHNSGRPVMGVHPHPADRLPPAHPTKASVERTHQFLAEKKRLESSPPAREREEVNRKSETGTENRTAFKPLPKSSPSFEEEAKPRELDAAVALTGLSSP